MQYLEYNTKDKSTWGDGPWQNEPDKRQWRDEATGLPCLIVRGPLGALCGYVGVSRRHKAYGRGYDDVHVEVHGGLTFAGPCTKDGNQEEHICHRVEPGEDDRVWWLGFDCSHAFDLSPAHEAEMDAIYKKMDKPRPTSAFKDDPAYRDVYRDIAYVEAEVAGLAAQLKSPALSVEPRWRTFARKLNSLQFVVQGLFSEQESFRRMSRLRIRMWASDFRRKLKRLWEMKL